MKKNINFLPERLKELRQNAGMTQKEFSEKIGCTMASLSAYENGSKNPPTQTLMNIASKFECSIDWLFGLKDTKNYDNKPVPVQTYSEFIKKLFLLDNDHIPFFKGCDCIHNEKNLNGCKGIAFKDPIIKLFLEKWRQTKKLWSDGTIDETIYTAWQEKVLRDFHYPIITNENSWEDFHDSYVSFSACPGFTEYDAILSALSDVTGFTLREVPHMD